MSVPDGSLHSPLHRPGEQRNCPDSLAELWGRESTHLLVVDAHGAHRDVAQPEPSRPAWDPDRMVYLGWSGDQTADSADAEHWFTCRGEAEGPGLRDATLSPLMRDLVTAATAILAWHDTEPLCERCGGITRAALGGFVRSCRRCGQQLFPRQDPAVIVAIVDGLDRLLLAHQASWPTGRVSVLAGFVEAGETIEQAAAREVLEEVGLRLTKVQYLVSQPWPFPRSLMLGMVAHAEGEPHPDGVEISWAKWFSRDDYAAAVASGEVFAPPLGSVAGRMIAAWLDASLPALAS